jgi:outer membrane protein assembly factor BamD (BamD/ComL family)
MAESKEPAGDKSSVEDHPLYHAAMKQMAAGDGAAAAAKLRQLAELFPQSQLLQDLLVRTELQATLAQAGPAPTTHSAPTPILRRMVLVLLVLSMVLIGIAGFAAAYARFVHPRQEGRRQDLYINSLRQDGQARLTAGDWTGAQQVFQELLTQVPGDPTAQAAVALSQQQEALAQQYADAVAAQQQDDVQTALGLFRQLPPEYLDVTQRIKTLEKLEALEAAWQQSESLIQAGDWPGAIAILSQIRAQNPEFRRAQVEEQLYQLYTQTARQQLAQANGSVEAVRQAADSLRQALALRPTQQDLLEEQRLASGFVAGADAAAKGDWAGAVARWEPVYAARPDYQGGVLRPKLDQAYPQAAKQLIARANGNVNLLDQALGYLDKGLAVQPDNQELLEERRLVTEFLAGAEAFAAQSWDLAISHWGPIYAVRPTYQNGVLERNLRQACASSPAPNKALCPP